MQDKMTTSINSKIKFLKKIPFEEWFEKNPDPVIDTSKIYTQEADQERFEANHPASRVYIVNPNDSLTKKCAKVALRFLFCVTIIPIICVKAIDFFKGQKRTPESDLNEKLNKLKHRIRIDQDRMLIMTPTIEPINGFLMPLFPKKPHLLPTSEKELDAFFKMILKQFKGDQRNGLRFLSFINQSLGAQLIEELQNDQQLKKVLIPERFNGMGDLLFTGASTMLGEREERDKIYVDFYNRKVFGEFELEAHFLPDSGGFPDKLASGIAKVSLDFKKKRVEIGWRSKDHS